MEQIHTRVEELRPQSIQFDPNNPRGESIEKILSSKRYKDLRLSVSRFGMLVPVVVRKDGDGFILVDGERRLRVAQELNFERITARIVEDEIAGDVLAYQIHTMREQWSKIAETKSIKRIIDDLKKSKPDMSDEEIQKELEMITGHKQHNLTDIVILLKYSSETIEKVENDDLSMSYLVQIETSFIKPLIKKYPEVLGKYSEGEIRDIMVDKAIKGKLKGTRYLMDTFNMIFKNEARLRKDKILDIFYYFLSDLRRSAEQAVEMYQESERNANQPVAKEAAESKVDDKIKGKTIRQTKTDNGKSGFSPINVSNKAQTTIGKIRKEYEGVGLSFSKQEEAYIAEALKCLETGCYKAATIMVWASAIERLFKYIDNNFEDFVTVSREMRQKPISVYKHFSTKFFCDMKSLDDIRLNVKDIQLCSYAYAKNLISGTEFKKLKNIFDTRCDCAHPTDRTISTNGAIDTFESLFEVIFSNKGFS